MYVDSREKVTARYQVIDMFKKNKKELLVHSPSYFDNNNRMPSFFFPANLSIKARSHGVRKLQTEGHTFTESSQGLGMEDSFVV